MASPLQLFDLYPELLLKLLREYVSFEDKLYTLWDIPEFHSYLEDRGAWITTAAFFSVPFLSWCRTLRLGWYIHRENWSHRFLLKLDRSTMTVSVHHFFLDYGLTISPSAHHVITCQTPLNQFQRLFRTFLNEYAYIPDMNLCTYHLKPYGLLMIQYDWKDGERSKMRFYDWEECILSFYTPILMKDVEGVNHFKLILTCDRTLTVECLLPAGRCVCEQNITNLLPLSWQVDGDGHRIKGIDGGIIFNAACQKIQMLNGGHIHSEMKYYLPTFCSDIFIETAGGFVS